MIVTVELQPDNETEQTAIKNTSAMTASDSERELVENYLHFGLGLGDYFVLQLLDQKGNSFTLKIFVLQQLKDKKHKPLTSYWQ